MLDMYGFWSETTVGQITLPLTSRQSWHLSLKNIIENENLPLYFSIEIQ